MMKAFAFIGLIFMLVSVSVANAEVEAEVIQVWPVRVDRPLESSELKGFIKTGAKSFLINFRVKDVSAVFYHAERKLTVVSFNGAMFANSLRTNILVSDDIMRYSEIIKLLNRQRLAKFN